MPEEDEELVFMDGDVSSYFSTCYGFLNPVFCFLRRMLLIVIYRQKLVSVPPALSFEGGNIINAVLLWNCNNAVWVE